MHTARALVVLLLAGLIPRVGEQPCLRYRPASVTLEGTLVRRADHGRSGRLDSALVLSLATPICVVPDSASDEGDKRRESGVRELQLAIGTDSLWASVRAVGGSRVRVSGELFHAIGGHERTRVLLWVIQIRPGA